MMSKRQTRDKLPISRSATDIIGVHVSHTLMLSRKSRKGRLTAGWLTLLCSYSLMLLLLAGSSSAAERQSSRLLRSGEAQGVQYKIFTLKHISAEQGKEYLSELDIGTVSQLPLLSSVEDRKGGALLVTAQPNELAKATAVLTLVDVEEKFAIKTIYPISGVENLPSNERIAAKIGGISIGTFLSPPENRTGARAIVDMHPRQAGVVVVIAPVGLSERLASVIKSAISGKEEIAETYAAKPAEPNEPVATASVGEQQPKVTESAVAARPYEPEPLPNADEILNLNLPEKVDIISLLDLVGMYLHLDYMYDPGVIRGGEVALKFNGKLRGAIRVKDLYPLLESVMKFRGFVMSRKGNLVTIVPAAQVADIDPTLQTDERKIQYGDVVITRPFQLQYIDTTSAANLLTSMKLGTSISQIPDTRMLIVTEYAYRMSRIEELLDMVDRPGAPRQFRFRQLKYTMAKTLAPKIKTLAEQLGTVSITIAPTQAAPTPGVPPGRRPTVSPAPTPAATQAGVYLDSDERTNRILMIGLEEQLTVVDNLIDALDTAQQDLRMMKVYKIQYIDAGEVKKKLQELGIIGGSGTPGETSLRITGPARPATPETAGQPPTPSPTQASRGGTTSTSAVAAEGLVEQPQVIILESTNSLLINATAEQHIQIAGIISHVDSETEKGTIPYVIYPLENQDPDGLAEVLNKLIQETIKDKEGKIEKVVKKTEEEIIIVPDKKTFSIIVYASKKNQEWISSLVKQLDEYRPQVLLDVTLVEIIKNENFTSDLDLVTKFPKLTPGGTMSGSGPTALLSPFRKETIAEAASVAGAGGKAFYADQHIQALLELMQEKKYGRVLAKPKLLVNDNEEGTIKTETKTSIAREQTQVIPGTTTTTPTYTTSVGFEGYTSGITLTITPHISKGEQVQLKVTLNRTDFGELKDYKITSGGETLEGPIPPDILSSDVTTKVTVPNGTTIILGGLERLKQSKGGTKVPFLGDVPLVGGLFRSTANTDEQSRLYVFVKAHVLRPGEEGIKQSDVKIVSQKNRDRFEKYEDEMQKYSDWPGIKPKPMDPRRVLEEE